MADVTRKMGGNYDTIYIRQEAIKTLEKHLVFADFATAGDLPNNRGSILRFHIDGNPTTTDDLTKSLTGSANAGGVLTNPPHGADHPPADSNADEITYGTRAGRNEMSWAGVNIDKQIHSYGGFIPVRNADLDDMPKNMMQRLGERLGYVGRHTLDTLCRATLDGTGTGTGFSPTLGSGLTGASVRKSIGDGTNDAVLTADDKLTAEDIALATGDLWGRDVEPFSNGFYSAVVHSGAAVHLVTDVSVNRLTWERMNRYISGYSGQEKLTKGHIGAVVGTMIIRSNNVNIAPQTGAVPGTDDAESYENIVLGKDCLGNVQRDDVAPIVYINRPNENSTDNPYRMFATAAFYFRCGPTLLDAARGVKLLSATGTAQA